MFFLGNENSIFKIFLVRSFFILQISTTSFLVTIISSIDTIRIYTGLGEECSLNKRVISLALIITHSYH